MAVTAAPANLVTTLNTIGQAEDVEDVIYRVSPEETPFVSSIGKTKASARYHEWQVEDLDAVDSENAAVEGGEFTLDAGNQPARVGNYCQIFTKTVGVSRTDDVVDLYGRDKESTRQTVLKGLALRRDMEAAFLRNRASQNESGTNPRKAAGALAWLTSNTSRGAGGANGGFAAGIVAAATNGTQRAFSEAQVKEVMAKIFNGSGSVTKARIALMGAVNKQQFSSFTGISGIRSEVKGRDQAIIHGAADYYMSDFGGLQVVPHAYGINRDCLIYDPAMFAVATLDGFKKVELAKTGDSTKWGMTHEATLVNRNQKAHGVVADLINT